MVQKGINEPACQTKKFDVYCIFCEWQKVSYMNQNQFYPSANDTNI